MRLPVSIIAVAAVATFSQLLPGQAAPPPELRLVEELRIDGEREQLLEVGTVRVGPGGRMLLSQARLRQILVFDSLGRRVATVGRAGEGPGEFDLLNNYIGWNADTIWAFDAARRSLMLFSAAGDYISTQPLSAITSVPGAGLLPRFTDIGPVALSEQGLVAQAFVLGVNADSRGCVHGCYVIISRNGIVTAMIERLRPVNRARITVTLPSVSQDFGVPLSPRDYHGISSLGEYVGFITTTRQDRTVGAFRVVMKRSNGDTVFAREYAIPAEAVSNDERRGQLTERIAGIRRRSRPPSAADLSFYESEALRLMPQSWPPVNRIIVGRDGSAWVELRRTRDRAHYIAIDASGVLLGRVQFKPGTFIREADGPVIWVTEPDADGVPSVVRYRVQ